MGMGNIGFVIILLVLSLGLAHAQTPLTDSQVYVKNSNAFDLSNDLVTIPISFSPGQQPTSTISNVKIGSLSTQVVPTSYHPDGTVRTAVAKVLASIPPGQEQIHSITTGSSPAFVLDSKVQQFLSNGQLTIFSKDLFGGTYSTTFDIDNTTFVKILESGPVTRVYQFEKNLRPIPGCSSSEAGGCLPYMFSTTVYVTAVSGKPHVGISVIVTNFGNLKEDTTTGFLSGPGITPNYYPLYDTGQNGTVFYDSMYFEIDTGSNPSTFYLLDSDKIYPSEKQIVSTTKNRVIIMPTDGQEKISALGDGPSLSTLPEQSNFIAAGQSLLTRGTLYLGTPLSYDYFFESNTFSGQSLSRWNKTGGIPFSQTIDPNAISPNTNWTSAGTATYNYWASKLSSNTLSHRWGLYDYFAKDMGAASWRPEMDGDPNEVIKYLMSCKSRCQDTFIRPIRWHMYASTQIVTNGIGYDIDSHPNSSVYQYREPVFENITYPSASNPNPFQIYCTDMKRDYLGFCSWNVNTSQSYRQDAGGNGFGPYYYTYPLISHGWTIRDAAHMSVGYEMFQYMLTGDYVGLFAVRNQVTPAAGVYNGDYLNYNTDPADDGVFSQYQGRDKGRALRESARLYRITHEEQYRTAAERILLAIDAQRNKENPSKIHPITGSFIPVKYFSDVQCGSPITGPFEWGQAYCDISQFEDSQIAHGLAEAYPEMNESSSQQLIRTMLGDYAFFATTFGLKYPTEVVNNVTKNGIIVNEGLGGLADYIAMKISPYVYQSNGQPVPFDDMKPYTRYGYSWDPQVWQGMCYALELYDKLGLPNASQYKSKFQHAFNRTWINPTVHNGSVSINPTSMFEHQLCGLHFVGGIPNATEGTGSYADADGDGFTTIAGDCSDSSSTTHPKASEWSCSDSIDNDCDGLLNCQDGDCSGNSACTGTSYCGNLTLNGTETCDVNPFVGANGQNTCSLSLCIPAYAPYSNLCQCATAVSTAPHLTGIDPSVVSNGVTALISLTGSNFANGATMSVGTISNVPTTWQNDPAFLTVTLSGTQVSTLGNGSHPVSVKNPDGQTTQEPILLTISAAGSSTPQITSISPNPIVTGQSSYGMTVFGSNFASGATVKVGSLPSKAATYNSGDGSLSFSLSSAEVSSLGTPPISVSVTVTVGTSTSSPSTLSITAPSTPPSLTSFNPLFANQQVNTDLTISGSNFVSGATIKMGPSSNPNLVTLNTTGAGTSLSTTLDSANANILPVSSALHIKVQNPDGQTSNVLTNFEVKAAKPSLQTITYSPIVEGQDSGLIRLNGQFFQTGAQAVVNHGTAKEKTYNGSGNPTLVAFTIPASDTTFLGAGTHNVKVKNPDGQFSSNALNFIIDAEPDPAITFIVPTSQEKDVDFTLTVNGSNFKTDSDILFGGVPIIGNITVNPNGTQMSTPIAGSDTIAVLNGSYPIQVQNPNGAISNAATITLSDPNPVLSNLSPPGPFTIGSTNIGPLTLTGLHFYTYGGLLLTNTTTGNSVQLTSEPVFQSLTSIQFSLTPAQATALGPGTISLTMKKGNTGILSNALTFTLNSTPASPPTLTEIAPLSIIKDGSSKVFTLTGSNFKSNSVVRLDNTPLSSGIDLSQIPTTITVTLSGSVVSGLNTTVPHTFIVENPGTPSLQSNPQSFTVSNSTPPAPQLVSVNPSSAPTNASTLLTISGTNLSGTTEVLLDSTPLSPFTLDTTIPGQPTISVTLTSSVASSMAGSNPHTLTVKDSFNQTSNGLPFTLTTGSQNPPLTLVTTTPSDGQSFAPNTPIVFNATIGGGDSSTELFVQLIHKKGSIPTPADAILTNTFPGDTTVLSHTLNPIPAFEEGTYYWQWSISQNETQAISGVSSYTISGTLADVPQDPNPTPTNNNGPTGGNGNNGNGGGGGGGGSGPSLVTPEETVPDFEELTPNPETCNGSDDDGDGTTDEGCALNLSVPVNTSSAFYFLLFLFNGIVSVLASLLQLVGQ